MEGHCFIDIVMIGTVSFMITSRSRCRMGSVF
jgi:hypothetical protein